jgi:hypothetical protein
MKPVHPVFISIGVADLFMYGNFSCDFKNYLVLRLHYHRVIFILISSIIGIPGPVRERVIRINYNG